MGRQKRKGHGADAYTSGGVRLGRVGGFWVAYYEHCEERKRSRLIPVLPEEKRAAKPSERARQALDQFADGRRAVQKSIGGQKIGALWLAWLGEREKDGYSNDVYEANWKALGPYFAARDPMNLLPDDWREYARQRFELGRKPATVHTELARLSNCLKWAAESHMIERRPKHWLPSRGKPRDRVLSPEEAGRLIAGAREGDPHIEVFVVLLFGSGGRHTAVLDLEWSRVDFAAGTYDLEVDLPPDPMNKSWRKGRANLVMSKMVRAVLERIHPGRTCDHVIEHGGTRLVTCADGFRNACERAGLGWYEENDAGEQRFATDVTPHTIRHTVASWMNGKVATAFTAALLGHEDEETTRKIYTHANAETTRPVVDIIDATFDALPHPENKPWRKSAAGRLNGPDQVTITTNDSGADRNISDGKNHEK